MKVSIKKTLSPEKVKTPAMIVFLFDEDKSGLAGRSELGGLKDIISPRIEAGDFKPDLLSCLTLFTDKPSGPERIILVGLGEAKKLDSEKLRQGAAKGVRAAGESDLESAAMLLPSDFPGMDDIGLGLKIMALGARLGTYRFDELKSKNKKKGRLKNLALLHSGSLSGRKNQEALEAARITAEAVARARDLVNRPANLIYPQSLADYAKKLARETGMKMKVITPIQAEKKGMGAFLAVAQGSARPGRIIILEYNGAGPKDKPVVLVGKAITFDSGGLNLKNAEGMVTMKTDMSGGAVVLGTIWAAAKLGLKKNLTAIVPAAENMPGPAAYRPGDVLKSMAGLTIEVGNTDAEGRLVLADGLALARTYKPKAIIDVATLTGACVIALGVKCAGLMGNDQDLIDSLKTAGGKAGERLWPLPLYEDYFEQMKSETADFKNTGGRSGGAITAGLFLKQFVKDTPWAHLDIAGPARADKPTPDCPAGGTAFSLQTLIQFLS